MSSASISMRLLFVFGMLVFYSCASVKVKQMSQGNAKPVDCQLPVFNDVKEVNGTYEVVCEIESTTGSALYNKRTAKAAIERAAPAACRCGADAMVVISSGRTDLSFFRWRRGIASVQAVKLNKSAAR